METTEIQKQKQKCEEQRSTRISMSDLLSHGLSLSDNIKVAAFGSVNKQCWNFTGEFHSNIFESNSNPRQIFTRTFDKLSSKFPGPAIMPDLLNIRLLTRKLIPLDVGGSGDCFLKSVSHHYMETRVITYRSELQVLKYLRTNPEIH